MSTELDKVRAKVLTVLAMARMPLPIVNAEGRRVVVVALAEEKLATLNARVIRAGGFTNVFVKDGERIRVMTTVPQESALTPDPNPIKLFDGHDTTVGFFMQYLELARQPVGIYADDKGSTILKTKEQADMPCITA